MQWFHQLRVMTKLVGSFLIVAAIGAIIGGLGIFHMGRISAATESLYGRDVQVLKG
jgi:methyl-accepting chemotaxis protein